MKRKQIVQNLLDLGEEHAITVTELKREQIKYRIEKILIEVEINSFKKEYKEEEVTKMHSGYLNKENPRWQERSSNFESTPKKISELIKSK